jgi:hypothetical protein
MRKKWLDLYITADNCQNILSVYIKKEFVQNNLILIVVTQKVCVKADDILMFLIVL